MIDLHAHILPGLDDGPPTMAASLAQARAAVAAGVREVVATPHIDLTYRLDVDTVHAAVGDLRAALERDDVPLTIRRGGEINMRRLPELDDETLRAVALGGGPWLLVECPFGGDAIDLAAIVEDLGARGHRVLLAHPERSRPVQRDPGRLARAVEAGALAQLTAGSLTGAFGASVRRVAVDLLRDGLVHVVASDTHDSVDRPPGAGDAFAALDGEVPEAAQLAEWMTEAVPAALLSGAPVPPRPTAA